MLPISMPVDKRTRGLFHYLPSPQRPSNHTLVKIDNKRWHVAVTLFRRRGKDSGLIHAAGHYLSRLFITKENAITFFVENMNMRGQRRDVMLTFADNSSSLREELLVIQLCLSAAGLLDERRSLNFDLDEDFALFKKSLARSGITYETTIGQSEFNAERDPTRLLMRIVSNHLKGSFGFTLHKNHLNRDPRLPFIAGIIALEAGSHEVDLSCQTLFDLMGALQTNPSAKILAFARYYLHAAEHYLGDVWAALKPEIKRIGLERGTVADQQAGFLVDDLIDDLLDGSPNFQSAFSTLNLLRSAFNGRTRSDYEQIQSVWALLTGATYLSAQVGAVKFIAAKPKLTLAYSSEFTDQKVLP